MEEGPRRGNARRRSIPSRPPNIATNIPPIPWIASRASSTASPNPSSAPKPLPRLQRPPGEPLKSAERNRVGHACEPCRRRKAKCDGGKPPCARCRDLEIECNYSDGKRERNKRDVEDLKYKLTNYEGLLKKLLPYQTEEWQKAIQGVLVEASPPLQTCIFVPANKVPRQGEDSPFPFMDGTESGEDADEDDEHSVRASVGSPKMQDRVRYDAAGFTRTSGFWGKASTVRWLEDVSEKLHADTSSFLPENRMFRGTERAQHSDEFNRHFLEAGTYHVNELDLTAEFGEFAQLVDPLGLPERATANALVQSYFTTLHPLFPIVLGPVFMRQYDLFWQSSLSPPTTYLWRAIMNMIFALGAIYAHAVQAQYANGDREHLLYFLRARVLSMDPVGMIQLPSLEHIQLASLSGMYLVASFQVNRAWHAVGLSIRYAQSRGLHLTNDTPGLPDAQRELEARIWHATCSLEMLLALLTGRTEATQDRHTSKRFPRPIQDHVALTLPTTSILSLSTPKFASSTPMLSFSASLDLDRILSESLSKLYSASTVLLTWSRVQKIMMRLNSKLEHWRSRLPSSLVVNEGQSADGKAPIAERMYLAVRYYSISMLINRPCLCINTDAMPLQSAESQLADNNSAARCVESAMSLVGLLPVHPDAINLYRITPWWCILHFIVQAGAVLTLEISLQCRHVQNGLDNIVADAGKVLGWLKAMSRASIPAFRAWIALGRLLQLALSKVDRDVGGLAELMPQQPHFSSDFGVPLYPEDPPGDNPVSMPSLAYNVWNPWVQATVPTSSVPGGTTEQHIGVGARSPVVSSNAVGAHGSYFSYDRGPGVTEDEEMTPMLDVHPTT